MKRKVEKGIIDKIFILDRINLDSENSLFIGGCAGWEFIYPYEEPRKKRMTNRQFVEWCIKGNGQWKWKDTSQYHVDYSYSETLDNKEVDENIHILPWGSDEWIEPTVDIYGDCKKE